MRTSCMDTWTHPGRREPLTEAGRLRTLRNARRPTELEETETGDESRTGRGRGGGHGEGFVTYSSWVGNQGRLEASAGAGLAVPSGWLWLLGRDLTGGQECSRHATYGWMLS